MGSPAQRWQRPFLLFVAIVLGLSALAPQPVLGQGARAQVLVDRDSLFFDRRMKLRVKGLEPGVETVLTVSVDDARKQRWWSQNVYVADGNGEVDPSSHEPVRGTYSGVHGMGPLWSMVGGERFFTRSSAEVSIQVSQKGTVLGERTVAWLSPRSHPGVTRESLRGPGFAAELYLPASGTRPVPAVLVLGGSGGGFNAERASLLASHGFAAMDLAYFGVEGIPRYFVETIPVEQFMSAVDILVGDSRVDGSRVAVMGRSYGAQIALLLASRDPRVRAVIAEAPSSFLTGTPSTYPVGPVQSAWSWDGEPLPFLNPATEEDQTPADPTHRAAEAHPAAVPAERISGPVLFVSGEADRIWASTAMADQLVHRMESHGFQHAIIHVHYPEAGHNFGGGEQAYGIPNLPPKNRGGSSGGTLQGNSVAAVAAWEEILAFLEKHLR